MRFFGVVFIGLYCLISAYIGYRGWQSLGRVLPGVSRKVYWGLFWLVAFSFPAAEMAEDVLPAAGALWLTMAGGYWLVTMLYLFLMVVFVDILRLLDKGLGFFPAKLKESKKTPIHLGATVVALIAALILYGTWNARNPIVVNYEVQVNKKAGALKELQIGLVSDLHYGAVIDTGRLQRMVEIMKEIKPDVIIIAGDIFDGHTEPEEVRKLTGVLSQMQAKYGKFAVPGNHDRVLRDNEEVLGYFAEAGVKVLMDDSVKIADSFYLVGRDDPGHRGEGTRTDLSVVMEEVDASLPVILANHQPNDLEEARSNKVDLQVSGHTHRGQLFPNHFITGMIYELDWGLLKKEDFHLVVSSGYGTWGPPLRIGNNPEVVHITAKFK